MEEWRRREFKKGNVEGLQKGERLVTLVKCRDIASRRDNSQGQRLVLKSHPSKPNLIKLQLTPPISPTHKPFSLDKTNSHNLTSTDKFLLVNRSQRRQMFRD